MQKPVGIAKTLKVVRYSIEDIIRLSAKSKCIDFNTFRSAYYNEGGAHMGAYAMYDGKPFRANRETIKLRRKRGMIDRNRELIRNAHLEYDEETATFILVKDDERQKHE